MPLGSALNSFLLFSRLFDVNRPTDMPVKKQKNDKPVVFPVGSEIKSLERAKPEDYGISQEYIDSFLNEIRCDHSVRLNRVLIVKDNKVIAERYEEPYTSDSWNCVFSTTKTLVALALGFLYDEGKVDLDLPVCKILKNEKKITIAKNKKITLRHLLTMSTGITFNESESASSLKWVKSYFDSNSKFKFGTKFDYNSLNTYIISVCVEKLAGKKFKEFVQEKLFDPLEINETHLDVSPEGYFIGGWGLYILPEDMAKLGIIVRDEGMYNGKQILSKEWINMMSHTQFEATKFHQIIDYGFQMWTDEKMNYCMFNGLYDQNIMIYRNSGIIVVTCCADSEAFHGSNLIKLSNKYFAGKKMGDFELCKTHGTRELHNEEQLMYYFDEIKDKEYKPVIKIANSCGIIPLLLQNELGTYARGIKAVIFSKEGDTYKFFIDEGHKPYELLFNFDKGVRQVLEMYGNKFDVSCDARFILSGKGEPYLVIRLFFLEFSSSRYFSIKFGKEPDVISMETSEVPGLDFINSLVEIQDEATRKIIDGLLASINPSLLTGTIKNVLAPSFIMACGEERIAKMRRSKKKPAAKKEVKKK